MLLNEAFRRVGNVSIHQFLDVHISKSNEDWLDEIFQEFRWRICNEYALKILIHRCYRSF